MSHVHPSAVLGDPRGTLYAVLNIAWLLPARLTRTALLHFWDLFHSDDAANKKHTNVRKTSIWLALATAVFAPLLEHNWHMLLARPWWGIEPRDGLLFPTDGDDKFRVDVDAKQKLSTKHGFHGYLYASKESPSYGAPILKGADAIWLHAYGGGFYAGEARMYHSTYLRWVNKAKCSTYRIY